MSGFDETTEEVRDESTQGDQWLGGGAEPSNHVEKEENHQEYRFDIPERSDEAPAWKGSVAEPKIENFSTIEEYESARRQYELLPPTPFADDPLAAKRQELENHINNYSAAADLATAKGDHARARHLKDMALSFAKDLQELPASPQREFEEAAVKGQLELMVDYLLDPSVAANPQWNNPRMQHDSAVVVDKANRTSSGRITLPAEDSEYGTLAPCTPSNMIVYHLDPSQLEGFREMVYGAGHSNDLDSVFRRSWDYLRQVGLDADGTRVERPSHPRQNAERGSDGRYVKSVTQAPDPISPTGGSPIVRKDPGDMSQAEYEAWRRKSA